MSTRQAALLLVIAAVLVRPPRESRTPPTAALRLPEGGLRRRLSHRRSRRRLSHGCVDACPTIASTSVPQNASTSVPQECCSLDSQSQVGFSRGESGGALEFRMTQRLARNSAQRAPFWLCWSFPAVCTGSASTSVPQECCSLDSQSQVGFSRGESEGALEFRMTQRLARNSAQRAPFWLCWSFPAVCTGSCLSFSRWRSAHSARGRASLRSDSASDAMCDWDMFHSSAPMQSRPQGAW